MARKGPTSRPQLRFIAFFETNLAGICWLNAETIRSKASTKAHGERDVMKYRAIPSRRFDIKNLLIAMAVSMAIWGLIIRATLALH